MSSTFITLTGYRVIDRIYEGSRTQVYRGIRANDQKPIVLKLLKNKYPTVNELVQFRNQYTIAKNLELPGIVKPLALENYRNSYALVMEDNGCVSLKQEMGIWGEQGEGMGRSSNSLREFLNIAIQIVRTLEGLHHNRIIHKDIKPDNILINPETQQVKLIDFSISSLLPRENQEIQNPNVLEGTLAYISPEQTGRMNRGIDYRTDFYSLGVTFYELLTGQLPFQSTDSMELVHCHIARSPTPPIELVPAIPVMVNDIVMKLMAKTAEERYQSAFGLRVDLETCLQQWLEKGSISQFPLGERDISERFVIPEKLYGREAEVATLLAAFDRMAGRGGEEERGRGGELNSQSPVPSAQSKIQVALKAQQRCDPKSKIELILVAGFSGIGKTAVVHEVHKPIVRERGYFIKGKFDQFKRNIPFWAWVQAFQNLMRQLLTETAAEVQNWKAKILEALGENGQVIIDVIPELGLIIGKQPPVPELEGSAAQNRFNLLFQKFIRLFTTKEHPLVIFLDDLQWADSASLKLIQLLMSETDMRYLLLIGAYRDNEVSPVHPLMLTLDEIRKANAAVNQITLAPLDQPSLNRLIADTLSCPLQWAVPLTELVLQKTQGNPFFTNQFLKSLHQDGLISFDFTLTDQEGARGGWQCDIAQVRALCVSDDVVDFMALQLQKLPPNTKEVLKLAACIGNQFDLVTLAIVHEKSLVETSTDLWRALQEGLVIPISEVYKFFQEQSVVSSHLPSYQEETGEVEQETTDNGQLTVPYKFLHDRVQQAAYSLISESEKKATHLKIGKLLLQNTTPEERKENIFALVNQLNVGTDLITGQEEKDELAYLNLIAGQKAKAATAYEAALRYLNMGLLLLSVDSWESNYDTTLALYVEAAEAEYLNTNYQQCETICKIVLSQAKTIFDKLPIWEIQIQFYSSQNQMQLAIANALEVLSLLGVSLPKTVGKRRVLAELLRTKNLLEGQQIEDLAALPEMTDSYKLAALRILMALASPVSIAKPTLFQLVILTMVNLCVEHGNSSLAAYAYGHYGALLCVAVGDLDTGYQFGQLSVRILQQFDARKLKPKVSNIFNAFVRHWKDHARETMEPLIESIQSGLEIGDLEYTGYSAMHYCTTVFFVGELLESVGHQQYKYIEMMGKLKQEFSISYAKVWRQLVLNLTNQATEPFLLVGEAFNELETLPVSLKTNNLTLSCVIYIAKTILNYFYKNSKQAVNNANSADQYLAGVGNLMMRTEHNFYYSLAILADYDKEEESHRKRYLNKVVSNQKELKKWAAYAPENYEHKYELVEAEKARVLGKNEKAIAHYEQAITGARKQGYIQEEALANELAGEFHLSRNQESMGRFYLIEAYYGYIRWGAVAKVEDIEKRYPQLLAPILNHARSRPNGETIAWITPGTVLSSTTGVSEALDLATVVKASQTLSGEIYLDKLLSTLMQVVIENAGASKCALILQKADNLVIEAIAFGADLADKVTQTTDGPEPKSSLKLQVPTVLQSIPIEESQDIPVSVLNYVWRTQETLTINDAGHSQGIPLLFAADPYIIQQQSKSILCTPIKNQGKLIGILYLENHLTGGAFTPDRLEVLKVLSSQAAISIENARLYTNLEEYNRTLETKVEERTQELSQTLDYLKATQEELIQSEKMAALGQLIAGIAHEINTPLGAIRASIENVADFLTNNLEELPKLFQKISPERQQDFFTLLHKATQQTSSLSTKEKRQLKKELKRQLECQSIDNADTLATTLVNIGVYDEIKPFLPLLKDAYRETILNTVYEFAAVQISTRTIATATDRAAKVVFALKSYAHYDWTGKKVLTKITDGIETVLILYQSQLKQGVEVIRNYEELPSIWCYPDDLNQVWTNLIHNALQAMNNKGVLRIDVKRQDTIVLVSITDSGKGILPEIMPKIFEPFFTTKLAGEGSGLGLDIVKKILEKHQGKIEVSSIPGKTTFTVYLPMALNEETSHA